MAEIYSYEEIDKLVAGKTQLAKSNNPVYLIEWRGIEVIAKKVLDSTAAPHEIAVHRKIHHPNIVQLIGHTPLNKEFVYLLMEYFPNGSLRSALDKKGKELTWSIRLKIASDIAKAMYFLHGRNILHRDLKAANIMVDTHFEAKLADFGESLESGASKLTDEAGTLYYMAPEMLKRQPTTSAADVYSFGFSSNLRQNFNIISELCCVSFLLDKNHTKTMNGLQKR